MLASCLYVFPGQTGYLRGNRAGDLAVLADGTIALASSTYAYQISEPEENSHTIADYFIVHLTEEGQLKGFPSTFSGEIARYFSSPGVLWCRVHDICRR